MTRFTSKVHVLYVFFLYFLIKSAKVGKVSGPCLKNPGNRGTIIKRMALSSGEIRPMENEKGDMSIMKKMCFLLAALFVAAGLFAGSVRTFDNFGRGGVPVLVPRVQKYEPGEGAFKLPEKFTVAVPAGEELIVEQLGDALERFPGVKVEPASEKALCRFVLAGSSDNSVPRHEQGYALTVTPEGITVASHTADGLFNGAQTLRNLLRNLASPELKSCRIVDWPDLDRRGYFLTIGGMNPKSLPQLKRTLDTLASLKMNWLLLELGASFPYENNPFTKRRNAFTRDQVLDLLDFCRKRHIRVTPTLQVWSHAAWMTTHPKWSEMAEDPKLKSWGVQPCPESELAVKIIDQAIAEHIELFGSPDFFLMMDEFYLGPFHFCPKCRKLDPYKQFSRLVKHFEEFVLERQVTPIICHDSFMNRAGRKWNFGDKLRGDLDRRTEILWWSYRDNLPEKDLIPFRDFKLIGHSIACKPLNTYNMVRLVKKYNGSASTLVYWYESAAHGLMSNLARETAGSLGGFVNGADFLWKYPDTPYPDLTYDATFEMVRRLYPEKAVAGPSDEVLTPVPIENSVNAELSGTGRFPRFDSDAQLDELKKALVSLPERFELLTSPGGKYYGMRLAGEKNHLKNRQAIRIMLDNRKIGKLAFLTTASRPKNMRAYAGAHYYGTDRFKFPVVAAIVIKYADGGTTELPLKYRWSITDWNRPFGGVGMRWAVRGLDADKNYYTFGIYEFENPTPERPIESLTFVTKRFGGVSPVILAISAGNVDKPFPSPRKVVPAAVARRPGVTDVSEDAALRIAADFEQGMGDVKVNCGKLLREKLKYEIVDDPTSPSKSKVLKISFPAGNYKGHDRDGGYVRVDVAMPYSVAKGTKSLVFDHRMVTTGKGFSHSNDYIVDQVEDGRASAKAYYRLYSFKPTAEWTRSITPLNGRSNSTNHLNDVTRTKFRKVSFFFNEVDAPVEIYIDNIGDTESNVSNMPMWKEGTEGEPM